MADGKRKLAAIMSADVVGYSRLMNADEAATVATLKEYRAAIGRVIDRHQGRIVNAPGDNILAEFASAVEAVQAAVDIQRDIEGRNAELAEDRRMSFRVGVNLGDVIEEDDGTIYGDGVNIAARMEALADSGGICIANTVYEAVEGKLDFGFDFLGAQQVKNLDKPVNVYRVRAEAAKTQLRPAVARRRRRLAMAAAAVVLVLVAGAAAWQLTRTRAPGVASETAAADSAVLSPATGPAIAVLRFNNISGDPDEDYFADGLSEDIMTELARFPWLRVTARNTIFQYKGQAVDIQQLGKSLGIDYVVEGSVRRADRRIRINVQLGTVADGSQVWAERYDREYSDVFAVQDEITSQVVATLASEFGVIVQDVQRRVAEPNSEQLQAYELLLKARGWRNEWRREAYFKSRELVKQAIVLDPDNAQAHVDLAWWTLIGWVVRFEGSTEPPAEIKATAIKAAKLDPSNPRARMVAAFGHYFAHQMGQFEHETSAAFELAPHDADIVAALGALIAFSGQWERGINLVNRAFDIDKTSAAGWYHSARFWDHYMTGEYVEAVDIIQQHPLQDLTETMLKYVCAYGQLDLQDKALDYWRLILDQEDRELSEESVRGLYRMWNFRERDIDKIIEGFQKAGALVPGLTN